jgi:hypothetical protein
MIGIRVLTPSGTDTAIKFLVISFVYGFMLQPDRPVLVEVMLRLSDAG